MNYFKDFPLPDWKKYQERIKADPLDEPRLVIEYYYNCKAVNEINEMRRQIKGDKPEERQSYRSRSQRGHRHYRISVGKITLDYPYLRGGIKPEQTMQELEALEDQWKKIIGERYISGESLRDLSRELTEESNAYSARSVDRIVQEQQAKQVEADLRKDFKWRDFLDLQLDGTYDKVRVEDTQTAFYKNMPLLRAIGLSQEELVWEFLGEEVYPGETILSYQMLLDGIIEKNIGDVYLVTSDRHSSLRPAILTTFIGVEYQACRFHLQKGLCHKSNRAKEIENMFRYIYDNAITREQSFAYFNLFTTALKQFGEGIYPVWSENFMDSIAYKDYPQSLARQISNTNKLERNNEYLRRRSDAVYSNPSKESFNSLAASVTKLSTRKWPYEDKGTALTASVVGIIHNSLVEPLRAEIDRALGDDYYTVFCRSRLGWKKSQALRINILAIPFKFKDRIITGGFILVHGIDKDKKEHLIHIQQIRHLQTCEVTRALEDRIKRGLKTDNIHLVIYNRPYRFLEEGVKTIFPNAQTFLEASSFLQRLLNLVPEAFKNRIEKLFSQIYESSNKKEAQEALERLKQKMRDLELESPLKWLEATRSEDLLSVFTLIENGIWDNYELTDFEIRNNWKTRVSEIVKKPEPVEKTIKALVYSFKRRIKTKGSE